MCYISRNKCLQKKNRHCKIKKCKMIDLTFLYNKASEVKSVSKSY